MKTIAETDQRARTSTGDTVHHFIGGSSVAGVSGRSGQVYDPARGVAARAVAFANGAEVDAAVRAAAAAYPAWAAASP